MAASSATAPSGRRAGLRRDRGRGVLGGVCAGIARALAVDPLLVRVAFLAAALAGGLGVALYALAWIALPAVDSVPAAPARRLRGGRGSAEVALGAALLLLSALLAMRELGVWFSDALVWPLVLVAAGGALLWRESAAGAAAAPSRGRRASPAAAVDATPSATPAIAAPPRRRPAPGAHEGAAAGPVAGQPAAGALGGSAAAGPSAGRAAAEAIRERATLVSRTSLGVALVIAAGLVFLQATGSLTAARDVVLPCSSSWSCSA